MKDSPRKQTDRPLSLLERKAWLVALAVTVIGFFMRLPEIFPWWLNPDEGIYFSMLTWKASAPFWAEMVGNANPPLYYLVIHALGLLTHNFAAIRALSLVFGTAAIYAAWLAGREIAYSERCGIFTGLFSALFVAVSPGAILFSQIIRPYTMLLLFLLLALYQLLRFRRERGTANLILYSIFLSIALLTHYSSLLAFGVFGILILSDLISGRFGFRDWPRLLAAHAVPVMICLGLYIYHLRPHMVNSALADEALNGWLASFMIYEVKDIGGRLIGFMGYLFGARLAGLAALIWAAGVALAYRKRSWTLLVVSLAAFGIAVIVATMGYYPFGCSRHSTWLIAFFVKNKHSQGRRFFNAVHVIFKDRKCIGLK